MYFCYKNKIRNMRCLNKLKKVHFLINEEETRRKNFYFNSKIFFNIVTKKDVRYFFKNVLINKRKQNIHNFYFSSFYLYLNKAILTIFYLLSFF